jgi:hypothetical protein
MGWSWSNPALVQKRGCQRQRHGSPRDVIHLSHFSSHKNLNIKKAVRNWFSWLDFQQKTNQLVPTDPRCSGKLARMGLGGILGGLAGRYAVGGKRSNKTVLGTTIGAFAGSLVGRATC